MSPVPLCLGPSTCPSVICPPVHLSFRLPITYLGLWRRSIASGGT